MEDERREDKREGKKVDLESKAGKRVMRRCDARITSCGMPGRVGG